MLKRKLLIVICMFIGFSGYSQINWLNSFDLAKTLAKEQNKLIIVDCWATWCGPCNRMDEDVWRNEEIKKYAGRFIFVKLDLSSGFDNPNFKVDGVPCIFIVDAWKHEYNKILGYRPLSEMKSTLDDFVFDYQEICEAEKIAHENESDETKMFELAMSYQKAYMNLETRTRFLMRSQSNLYFKKALKKAEKNSNKELIQKTELMCCLNKSAKKRMKMMKNFSAENEELSKIKDAILVKTYVELGDKDKAKELFAKVKDLKLPTYDFLSAERSALK